MKTVLALSFLLIALIVNTSADTTKDEETVPQPTDEVSVDSKEERCIQSKVTKTQRENFLSGHNDRRSFLANGNVTGIGGKPFDQASDMRKLMWSCLAEKVAQKVADKCSYQAQNLVHGINVAKIEPEGEDIVGDALKGWWRQKSTTWGQMVDEQQSAFAFRQMSWAKTAEIGCGISSKCDDGLLLIVCAYFPRGGGIFTPMYEVGKPCSRCEKYSTTECENSLCIGGRSKCDDNFSTDFYCQSKKGLCELSLAHKLNCKKTCGACEKHLQTSPSDV